MLKQEPLEQVWMNFLMPRNYVACVIFAFSGTLLAQNQSSTVCRSVGQALQLMGMGSFLRILGSLYDTPNSGKGI